MRFGELRDQLLRQHGPQEWWPADSPFEIMVGALLVQRTTWSNAAKAIAALQRDDLLAPTALAEANVGALEANVRPAGFFRTKAQRLRRLGAFVVEAGGMESLARQPTIRLRETLLTVDGIGPETADAILLYAFGRPAVVVDAYLRRITGRVRGSERPPPDREIVSAVLVEIDSAHELGEFHALVVAHGKTHCRSKPRCHACSVRRLCRTAPR